MIYFDNASTSFPKPQSCLDSVNDYLKGYAVSPARGGYSLAKKVEKLVSETKRNLGVVLGLESDKIFFSMNATHSLNIIIRSILVSDSHALICSNSHNSVIRPVHFAKQSNQCSYDVFDVELDGSVDVKQIESYITDKTKVIVLNHASNVTGQIVDYARIVQICKKNNLLLLLDATQTAGYFHEGYLDADFVVGTGHKALLGPTGIGFFYCKHPEMIDSLLHGGTGSNSFSPLHPEKIEEKFEAGTPNLTSLFGLLGSLRYIQDKGVENIYKHCQGLRSNFIAELRNNQTVVIHETDSKRSHVPVVSFNVKNAHPNEIAELLNESNICVRSGLHCSPLTHKSLLNINGSVRVSFSHFNTLDEIAIFIRSLSEITDQKKFTYINL